jgi:enterochelin esterase family protein
MRDGLLSGRWLVKSCTIATLLVPLAAVCAAAPPKGPSPDDQYKKLAPDSLEQPGVPRGKLERFTWDRSQVFPGTTREVTVYVPAQYDGSKPAAVFVCQDGVLYKAPTVFDNLIARKEMPVTIGIFIQPGDFPLKPGEKPRKRPDGRPAPRANRSKEYDTLSDAYARFLVEEILPEVGRRYRLSTDPDARCIAGSSSGGICAFTVCWQRPDQFRKCFTTVGSFTNIRGGNKYPELVRSAPRKPIRIFQQDGANDLVNQFGSWPEANKAMAKALEEKGYDHKFVFGEGVHSGAHGTQIFPDVMRWMWRDFPK